jgi:hypothetical protein
VCELDIIFNFEKAYFILDEFLMGGDVQDTSKKSVLKAIEQADLLQEVWSRDSEEDEYCGRGDLPSPGHSSHLRRGPLPVVSSPHHAQLYSLPSSPDPTRWKVELMALLTNCLLLLPSSVLLQDPRSLWSWPNLFDSLNTSLGLKDFSESWRRDRW